MFANLTLANPRALWLLAAVPLLVAYYLWRRRRMSEQMPLSTLAFVGNLERGWRVHTMWLPEALRMLVVIACVLALTKPQSSNSRSEVQTEGIDIVMAVDVSSSMLAKDFKPDRLEACKKVGMQFVRERPQDRVGLVIYSAEAYTQCPLTTDHDVLLNLFGKIELGNMDDGTAIGDGLGTAINRLRRSEAKSKVIILLTDGVNNTGSLDPLSAAEIAKDLGIRIYTIGCGTMGTAPYPMKTPFGIQYVNVPVEIDEQLLQEVAKIGDGKYFRATDNRKLEQIYKEIDKMEKSRIDVVTYRRSQAHFQPFVLAGLILLLLEMLSRLIIYRKLP